MFMKSSRVLFLLAGTMINFSANAIMLGGNRNNGINVTKALRSQVDDNGQTILHKLVDNCDNDDFTVSLRLFDFIENELPALVSHDSELGKKLMAINTIFELSPELAQMLALKEVHDYIETKDNNGDTALDIAKRRNEKNLHQRCGLCIEFLEIFNVMNKAEKAE